MVLQLNAFVDGDIILDPDPISNPDIRADIDILSEGAVVAQRSAFLDMAEMPYLGSIPDGYTLINVTALMNEETVHFPSFDL